MNKHIRKVLSLLQHRKQIQQISPPHQQPTFRTSEEWSTYWKAQGQPWRTEPEIDTQRQEVLARRRTIVSDTKQGIYPFKGVKLSRADVEWLLATHESGGRRGPVEWSDESQRVREGLDVRGADLCQTKLSGLPLARMRGGLIDKEWAFASIEQRYMARVLLKEAYLVEAQLQKANLVEAQLQEADLRGAQLQEADLRGAQLQKADLRGAQLDGVYLEEATFGDEKQGAARLADIRWGEINLAVVNWMPVKMLGDERLAHQTRAVDDYRAAVRANRQLAVVLRDQGLNEEADRFAYRAQRLQRIVLRRQAFGPKVSFWQRLRNFSSYVFSLFLDLLAGYGYQPGRSIVAYLVIIFGFMGLYLPNSHFATPHLRWDEALVLSVSSFHGRGFFSQNITLGDTYARLAAIEAVVGLVIEISFIATFTQRFFGR